tara:strand:+ start:57 stop:200 length:144 start_codon:yes stop_codon:yes gene_type:complete
MAQQATHSPAFVTRLSPETPKVIITKEVDTNPSDQQPPGVDEEEKSD